MSCRLCLLALMGLCLAAPLSAAAQQAPAQKSAPEAAQKLAPQGDADRQGEAYFNFSMGHYYEELYEDSGRSEHSNLSIEHYKKAYAIQPRINVIGERLAEMYYKAHRIRDAVLELQSIIQRDPDDVSARRLLARIYVRTLGDRTSNPGSRDIVSRAAEQYREILRLDPSDTEAAIWLARLYRLQGDDLKAEEVLRSVLAQDPQNTSLLQQLTQSLLDQGKAEEAVKLLDGITQRVPAADLFVLLGDAATQLRDLGRAEQAYRRAVELEPRQPEQRRKLAQCLMNQDKPEAALEQFQKLLEFEPEDPDNFLRVAQLYRQLKKFDLAEENLLRARQLAPGSLEVVYTEALLYEDQGRFEDAIRVLSGAVTALKANPARVADSKRTLVVLYEQLARLYRETGNFTAAVSTLQEMLKFDPETEKRARTLIADTYRESKDMPRAIAESEKALEIFSGDRGLRVSHALLLGENGDTDRAAALLRESLRGDVTDREIYIALAQVFERGRRFADAEQAIRAAEKLARTPSENEGVWFLLGAVYERQKKFDLAEEQFKRVLDLNPRNAPALNYYGYMLADRGIRLDDAAALIRRALEQDPHSGAYLDSLGWAFFRQNNFEEAEKYLRRAAERSGQDPTIREHLGDLYFRIGRIQLAAAEWERALAEWRRALPTERDADRVAEIEKKFAGLKNRLAQKSAGDPKNK